MDLGERVIVPERDEKIPGDDGGAAEWLSKQGAYEHLPRVAINGPTALFWYVAGLLQAYKEYDGHPKDQSGQQPRPRGDRTSTVWGRLARLIRPRR